MLVGEPASVTAQSTLDFIKHHQPFMLVAKCAHFAQIFDVGDMNTAFSLDGLDQNGNNVVVVFGDVFQCFDIVERCSNKSAYQRFEAGLNFAITASRLSRHRAAVKAVLGDDYSGCFDVFLVAIETRKLDGGFVGFRA